MSLFVHALNSNYVSQAGLGQIPGRMFSEGVIGENDLVVSEKSTGTNMSVDVATGALILHSGSGFGHILYSSDIENVAIAPADALNPRKSLIVAVLDTDYTNAAVNDSEGGWSIIEVAGTAASTPAEPDDAAIQTAAGAGNLYQVLYLVDVGAGVTEIEDGYVTDRREFASLQVSLPDNVVTTPKIENGAVNSAKLVQSFFKGRYQSEDSGTIASSDQSGLTVQFGWVQIQGDGSNSISQSVTFPTAFSQLLLVQGGSVGGRAISTPLADFTSFDSGTTSNPIVVMTTTLSNTGFTLQMIRVGGTFGSSAHYACTWIAIGII